MATVKAKANRKKGQAGSTLPVRNYAFKVKRILEGAEVIDHQMLLAHRYRNKLVEIERARRLSVAESLHDFDPSIPRLVEQLSEVCCSIGAIERELDERSQRDRERARLTAEERARLRGLKAERGSLEGKIGERKKAAFADPALKAILEPIEATARSEIKAARAASGLHWGTYNAVEETTRNKEFKGGPPPDFRRWDPKGTVAVQVQKRHQIEWCGFWLGRHRQFRIESAPADLRPKFARGGAFLPPPDPDSGRSKGHRLAVVWMRIESHDDPGRSPVWAKLLVHLHREPPPDAILTNAYLHRSLVGGSTRWDLRIVLKRREWPVPRAADGIAGIDLRWRRIPEGLLLAHAEGSDGRSDRLVIPDDKLEKLAHSRSIRSIRDREYNAIRARFSDWLKGKGVALLDEDAPERTEAADAEESRLERELKTGRPVLPSWFYDRRNDVRYLMRWKSPERLAKLVWIWGAPDEDGKSRRFPGDRAIFKELDHWRRRTDRHLHDYEDHEYRKVLRWRDEEQRRFASRISRNYKAAILTDADFARATRAADPGEEDHPQTRVYSRLAAPGQLRAFLGEKLGDAADGGDMHQVPGKDFAVTCSHCGTPNEVDVKTTFDVACSHCGAAWDLSENAARNYLRVGRKLLGES